MGSTLPRTARGPAVLEVRGEVKGGPFRLGEADLAALDRRTLVGVDPADGQGAKVRYAGVDLARLLFDRVELTGDADTVLLHTADRMVVPVPLAVVRQLRPVLADRADAAALDGRLVAWPNVAQPGMGSEPRAPAWWARRVTVLEVASAARKLGGALHVAEAALPGARPGAALYGARCLPCHRVRGVGGERGPDLTRVADRLAPADLARKLAGHAGWTIPGQAEPTLQAAAQLDAFLRTVAAYEALPGSRPGVEEPGGEPRPP